MCEISLCYACRELLSDAFDVMVAEPALFKGKCDNCNKRNALEKCVVVKKGMSRNANLASVYDHRGLPLCCAENLGGRQGA